MRLFPLVSILFATACGGRPGDLLVRDGVEHAKAGRRDEARAHFEKALVRSPGVPGARTGLAALEADRTKARDALDRELGAHPTLPEARFDRARLLLLSGTVEDAKAALTDLAPLDAADPEVARLVTLARFMAGETTEVPPGLEPIAGTHHAALALWQRFTADPTATSDGVPPDVLAAAPRLHAALLARAGRWADALAALPATPETAVDRAVCLVWLERYDEARALAAEAIVKTPDDARARRILDAL